MHIGRVCSLIRWLSCTYFFALSDYRLECIENTLFDLGNLYVVICNTLRLLHELWHFLVEFEMLSVLLLVCNVFSSYFYLLIVRQYLLSFFDKFRDVLPIISIRWSECFRQFQLLRFGPWKFIISKSKYRLHFLLHLHLKYKINPYL